LPLILRRSPAATVSKDRREVTDYELKRYLPIL
jgi:hypothetical protein